MPWPSSPEEVYLARDWNKPLTGDLSFGGHRATNAADPVNEQDLATKSYVDAAGGGATQAYVDAQDQLRILKTGDTMTGPLVINPPARSGLSVNTDVAEIELENRGVSVMHGNLAVGTSAGGPDLDIRQTAATPSGGIRIRDSANTSFFQIGRNNTGKLEITHTDDTPDITNIVEMSTNRVAIADQQLKVTTTSRSGSGILTNDSPYVCVLQNLGAPGPGVRPHGLKIRLVNPGNGGSAFLTCVTADNLDGLSMDLIPNVGMRVRTNDGAGSQATYNAFLYGREGLGYNSNQSRHLSDVLDPTLAQDVATKNYVDVQSTRVHCVVRAGLSSSDVQNVAMNATHKELGLFFPFAYGVSAASWNAATGRFTAPAPGAYSVSASLRGRPNGGSANLADLYISVNGDTNYSTSVNTIYLLSTSVAPGPGWVSYSLSGVVSLDTGDTIGLISSNGAGTWQFHSSCVLQITRVSI